MSGSIVSIPIFQTDNIHQAMRFLEEQPSEDRKAILCANYNCVRSMTDLLQVLHVIPIEQRYEVIIALKVLKEPAVNIAFALIVMLPIQHRLLFLKFYFRSQIRLKGPQFLQLLLLLEGELNSEILDQIELTTVIDLSEFKRIMIGSSRDILPLLFKVVSNRLKGDMDAIRELIDVVPISQRLSLIRPIAKSQRVPCIVKAFNGLIDDDELIDLINECVETLSGAEYVALVKVMPTKIDRIDQLLWPAISSIDELVDLLRFKPLCKRHAIAKRYLHLGRSVDDFASLMSELNERGQLALLDVPYFQFKILRNYSMIGSLFASIAVEKKISLTVFNKLMQSPFNKSLVYSSSANTLLEIMSRSNAKPVKLSGMFAQFNMWAAHRQAQINQSYCLLNLSRLPIVKKREQSLILLVPERSLIIAVLRQGYSEKIKIEDIERFIKLVWTASKKVPEAYSKYFQQMLFNNRIYIEENAFLSILRSFENFISAYMSYIEETSDIIEFDQHFLDQLGACAGGVQTALDSMTKDLSAQNIQERVSLYIRNQLHSVANYTTMLLGVSPGSEIHFSHASAYFHLGMPWLDEYQKDRYLVPYEDIYIEAIVRQTVAQCSLDELIEAAMPFIYFDPPKRVKINLSDPAVLKKLNNQLKELTKIEILTEGDQSVNILKLLSIILDASQVQVQSAFDRIYAGETLVEMTLRPGQPLRRLCVQFIEEKLVGLGVYQSRIALNKLQDDIWRIMTLTDLTSLPFADHVLWGKLLIAYDGIGLILDVLEKRKVEIESVNHHILLFKPLDVTQHLLSASSKVPGFAMRLFGFSALHTGTSVMFKSTDGLLLSKLMLLDESERFDLIDRLMLEDGAAIFILSVISHDTTLGRASLYALIKSLVLNLSSQVTELFRHKNFIELLFALKRLAPDPGAGVSISSFISSLMENAIKREDYQRYWKIRVHDTTPVNWSDLALNQALLSSLIVENNMNLMLIMMVRDQLLDSISHFTAVLQTASPDVSYQLLQRITQLMPEFVPTFPIASPSFETPFLGVESSMSDPTAHIANSGAGAGAPAR